MTDQQQWEWPLLIDVAELRNGNFQAGSASGHWQEPLAGWKEWTETVFGSPKTQYLQWQAARAWAGLAMWCMCIEDFGIVECWRCRWRGPMQLAIVEEGDLWECHTCYGEFNAFEACRAWQHFRAFLDGTPEQWAEREQAAYQKGVTEGFDRGLGVGLSAPPHYGVAP